MNVFLEWLLDPINNDRLQHPKHVAGHKVGDIHKEIAKYVNDRCGTDWKPAQVKTKIKYAKEKYIKARNMSRETGQGDTDESTLRERMLAECPLYDQFHAVYVGNVSVNPPPARHSISFSDDEAQSIESEEETSDLEEQNGSVFEEGN